MAKRFNLDRKKRKLKRFAEKNQFDTVLLDNGKVKQYCGERSNVLFIYKYKLGRFVNLIGKAGNERIFDYRYYCGDCFIGNHYLPYGLTDT